MTNFEIKLFDSLFANCMQELSKLTSYPVHQSENILWSKSDLPSTWHNCICNLSDDNKSKDILYKTIRTYIESRTSFYLYNGIFRPGKESIDTILSAGAEAIGYMDGMVFDLSQKIPNNKNMENITIKPVLNESEFRVYSQIQAEANEVDTIYFTNFAGLKSSSLRLFTAYLNDLPAGCSLIYLGADNIALNNWDWVKPEFKKQGINSAMVIERLKLAKSLGYDYVTAQCIDTSTRLYAKIGFKKLCEFDIYERYLY